jgi:hypothetical protein
VTVRAVCHAENSDGFRFCGNSGSPLAAVPPEILGDVLAASGRRTKPRRSATRRSRSRRKQDVVSAARVRRLRDELAAKA